MQYKQFTEQSPRVSAIGMGTWQLGQGSDWKSMSEQAAITLVQRALELGVNFFDTAPNYGLGTSELRLGKALKGVDRSKIVINTKFGHTETGEMNYDAHFIRKSVEGSLKRLQVDYIDSLLLHNPPFKYIDGNKTDHYEILEQLKKEGKIMAYGASLDSYEEMKLLMETTECQVIEAFFNILHQDTARAFAQAQEKGVAIIAKIPLDSGWLSGKYDESSVFNDIRKRWTSEDISTRAKLVNRLKERLGEEGNLAQVAIAFCFAYDAVSTVIPGNTSIAQLENNLESIRHPLSKEVIKKLERFYVQEVKPLALPW